MADILLGTLRDYWKKIYDSVVAHDAVDSGDPLKVGGKASTAAPTAVSVGDRVNAWFDLNGRLVVIQDQASALPTGAATSAKQDTLIAKDFATQTTLAALLAKVIAAPATEAKQDTLIATDFSTETTLAALLAKVITAPATEAKQDTLIAKDFATQTTLAALLAKVIASPSTEAKQDSSITSTNAIGTLLTNIDATALASAARTATVSSADLTNSSGKGVHIVFDVTAITDTPSVTLKIEGKDALSGKYYTILESAAVTTVSTNIYRVHPNLTASPNLVVNDMIPKTFRITMTHADADSITYSVGYSLV